MNADGTNPTKLTNNPAVDANSDWQPIPLPPAEAPEPGSLALLTCGIVGLGSWVAWRNRFGRGRLSA